MRKEMIETLMEEAILDFEKARREGNKLEEDIAIKALTWLGYKIAQENRNIKIA